jgi:hypothetical protein
MSPSHKKHLLVFEGGFFVAVFGSFFGFSEPRRTRSRRRGRPAQAGVLNK